MKLIPYAAFKSVVTAAKCEISWRPRMIETHMSATRRVGFPDWLSGAEAKVLQYLEKFEGRYFS